MDTTINPAAQGTIDQLNAPAPITSQSSMQTLDQSDFLLLLTTQLTLQDPLEPMNNEEMLAQMAQFSSLEAATDSSDSLAEISAKLDNLIAAQNAAAEAATEAARSAAEAAALAAQSIELGTAPINSLA